jgi:hypothetical protein
MNNAVFYGPNGGTLHVTNQPNDRTITVIHSSGDTDLYHASTTVNPNVYTGLNNTTATVADDGQSITVVATDGTTTVYTTTANETTQSTATKGTNATNAAKGTTKSVTDAETSTNTAKATNRSRNNIQDEQGHTASTYANFSVQGFGNGGGFGNTVTKDGTDTDNNDANSSGIIQKRGQFGQRGKKLMSSRQGPGGQGGQDDDPSQSNLYVLKTSTFPLVPNALGTTAESGSGSSNANSQADTAQDMFDSNALAPTGFTPIRLTRTYM